MIPHILVGCLTILCQKHQQVGHHCHLSTYDCVASLPGTQVPGTMSWLQIGGRGSGLPVGKCMLPAELLVQCRQEGSASPLEQPVITL